MKILVFGKNGQVARELARLGGRAVICLGRDDADFCDPSACIAAIETIAPDIIINAAAYTAVDKAESEADLALQINATTPAQIAKVSFARDIPFLHISTDYVFDGSGTKCWAEGDTPAPLGIYGQTKYQGEQGIITEAGAGAYFAILRTSWVFSPFGANFVKTMLRLGATDKTLAPKKLSIVSDQIGGPTGADSIAGALLKIAASFYQKRDSSLSGIYHYGGAPFVSWADFATEIFNMADLPVEITPIPSADYPTPAPRPQNSRMDCARILAAFNIKQPDWRLSLGKTIAELSDPRSQLQNR
ncbi:MAG: dTDP-4-dehydrorhamnose reductase [Proteobacteria bacterium]|nr:dTDP-4-dehydrorhamnose reductase [Pseudomonadota bacterium]